MNIAFLTIPFPFSDLWPFVFKVSLQDFEDKQVKDNMLVDLVPSVPDCFEWMWGLGFTVSRCACEGLEGGWKQGG